VTDDARGTIDGDPSELIGFPVVPLATSGISTRGGPMADTAVPNVDVPERRPADNRYVAGNFASVEQELTAYDLSIVGQIPAELEGRWLRNGPNPVGPMDEMTHHWFLGNGMVHGVRLRGGRAEWYRNRFVGDDGESGANTSVGGFAGSTWAIVEGGNPPVELDYELSPRGPNRFFDTLTGPFSAHPKYDPTTGELHAMAYHWPDLIDRIHYVVVGSDGLVSNTLEIPVTDMPMIHDMSLTERYAVVYDLPVTVNLEVLARGYPFPFAWAPDRAAHAGLLPRSGEASEIVWCEVDPCYVFHPLNAYDAPDGNVVVDVCRYARLFENDLNGPFGDTMPTFDRWVIDPMTRRVHETRLDDRPQEFPRHDPRVALRPHRYGYTAEVAEGPNVHGDILKHDLDRGTVESHGFGFGRGGAEPVVVPKEGRTEEDAAWILTVVYDATDDTSELCILDAEDIGGPEIARIKLPQRVPFGFHGNWVPDSSVAPN
jgi:carotenoid cleavage dioxygenase-like enzyme